MQDTGLGFYGLKELLLEDIGLGFYGLKELLLEDIGLGFSGDRMSEQKKYFCKIQN